MSVYKTSVQLCSYFPNLDDDNLYQALQTDLSIKGSEFENFDVKLPSELTFCLKEMKAMISYCMLSSVKLEKMRISFSHGGAPLQVFSSTKQSQDYTIGLIIATAQQLEVSQSQSQNSMALSGNLKSQCSSSINSTKEGHYDEDEFVENSQDDDPYEDLGDCSNAKKMRR